MTSSLCPLLFRRFQRRHFQSYYVGRSSLVAPPGSTRHISVSDAFARGAAVQDCLAAGDWTGVQIFFITRHYLCPSSSVTK